FHRKCLKDFMDNFNNVCDIFMTHLDRVVDGGKPTSMLQEFTKVTLEAMSQVSFNINTHAIEDTNSRSNTALSVRVQDNIDIPLHPTLLGIFQFKLFQNAIKREQIDAAQFLRKFASDYGSLTLDDIIDEFVTIFLAGQETTANSSSFTLYEIIRNSHVEAKLLNEVNEVLHGRDYLEFDDLAKLKYFGQVLEESLRKYPVAPAPSRVLAKYITVGGYHIPKGNGIDSLQIFFSMNPEIWENPDIFDPERFSETKNIPNFSMTHFPFSIGPRNCIGLLPGQTNRVKARLTSTPRDGVMCEVTLSVYPHRASLKNMPDHGGNRTYDLWNTSPMLCQLSYAVWSVRLCDITEQNLVRPDHVAQLAEHWASIPKVVGSIPTVKKMVTISARNTNVYKICKAIFSKLYNILQIKIYSYLHSEWATAEKLMQLDKRVQMKIKRFFIKRSTMPFPDEIDDEPFNPDYVEVDRVLDVSTGVDQTGAPVSHYLVKWRSLAYDESTWEVEADVDNQSVNRFRSIQVAPPPHERQFRRRPHPSEWRKLDKSPMFKNSNTLREYQLEGLNWLTFCWYNGQNCILADEMGLGKTIQSLAFLIHVMQYGIRGPFLVIAPLSTIANWQREFESWGDTNVVVHHGSAASRHLIQQYEFYFRGPQGEPVIGLYKFNVLITTYEILIADNILLSSVPWRAVVIDEAHRLKNRNCKLLEGLNNLQMEHRILLTGTPLQNNVDELFSLLNFLEPAQFPSQGAFLMEFGNLRTEAQVERLQALLRPMMLRRMKEDVEKSLAPKEETIVEAKRDVICDIVGALFALQNAVITHGSVLMDNIYIDNDGRGILGEYCFIHDTKKRVSTTAELLLQNSVPVSCDTSPIFDMFCLGEIAWVQIE
ncbi:chromodomain-helicase-DNA-binding 8-like, partial [Paramuricea clavata]